MEKTNLSALLTPRKSETSASYIGCVFKFLRKTGEHPSAIRTSAVFAELELSIIRARVKSGMANAKDQGRQIGRRKSSKADIPAAFWKHYPAYAEGKMNVSELARVCGVSRPTVHQYLRMGE
mgnify:FL=1